MIEPRKPPVIAPRKSDGAKMPPDPPLPIVIEVATIFASNSAPSITSGSWSVSASVMVL